MAATAVDAWLVPPNPARPPPSRRIGRRSGFDDAGGGGTVAIVSGGRTAPWALASSASAAAAAIVGSSSTTTKAADGRDATTTGAGGTPRLRRLYDPIPPRRENDVSSSSSSSSTTTTTVKSNGDEGGVVEREQLDGWTTGVTSGTMPADDGSPHVLYYEIHRRRRLGPTSSSSSSSAAASVAAQSSSDGANDELERGGLVALFLHGGPGAGCYANHVRFFDPDLYGTVVLLDQRGCGRSVPTGEVDRNDLGSLVSDVERLRARLLGRGGGDREDDHGGDGGDGGGGDGDGATARPWDVILGGSWGCTLALAYAHAHPRGVRAMVLRGVCLFRPREIDWLFGDPPPPTIAGSLGGAVAGTSNLRSLLEGRRRGGASSSSPPSSPSSVPVSSSSTTEAVHAAAATTAAEVFPQGWEEFRRGSEPRRDVAPRSSFNRRVYARASAPSSSSSSSTSYCRRGTLHRYYHLLLGSDPIARYDAVKSWLRWEMGIYSSGFRDRGRTTTLDDDGEGNDADGEGGTKEDTNNTVLVWYPSAKSWTYEDARVWDDASFVSIGVGNATRTTPPDEMAQSLRRFSPSPSTSTSMSSLSRSSLETSDGVAVRPMPAQPALAVTKMEIARGNNNSSFDPTTFIPAQSMLTAFYSANDEYCIGKYTSFLSLELPPPSVDAGGVEPNWYSSALPPRMPQLPLSSSTSSQTESSSRSSASFSSFPLPPTIAIQGGNDAICPPDTALDLHHVWKELELRILVQSGHSMYDPLIAGEIVKALDRFGHYLKENE